VVIRGHIRGDLQGEFYEPLIDFDSDDDIDVRTIIETAVARLLT